MHIPLWEWTVAEGARNSACGVSSTRHKAMDALALTLLSEEGHAAGVVAPLTLVNGTGPLPVYLRRGPVHFAECSSGVITWRKHGAERTAEEVLDEDCAQGPA